MSEIPTLNSETNTAQQSDKEYCFEEAIATLNRLLSELAAEYRDLRHQLQQSCTGEMAATTVDSTLGPVQPAHMVIDVDSTVAPQIQEIRATQARTSTQHRLPSSGLLFGEQYLSVCVPLYFAALQGDWELYNAALQGNWKTAKDFLGEYPRWILGASITKGHETALHVAVGAKNRDFVEKLVTLMEPNDLALQDEKGNTAFCFAAATGNVEIANILMQRKPNLPTIRGGENTTPLYIAALFGHNDMALLLYYKTEAALTPEDRKSVFFTCIETGLYDLALKMLEDHSELAVARDKNNRTALHVLAGMPSPIASINLGTWKSLINSILGVKSTQHTKPKLTQSLRLVECLWGKILRQPDLNVIELVSKPSPLLFDAAKLGNFDFLTMLIRSYPDIVWETDDKNRSIFHIAILNRHANIFNLIHEIGSIKDVITTYQDQAENNILHLAAKCPQANRLNIVSGAALQMQRELLWFKEVEKIVQPSFPDMKNSEGQTPRELFAMEHSNLLGKGESWMKGTAESCMLVSTLIATVVFAAAFSVPGGNDNNSGLPIHLKENMFQIFAMSEAVALSSSSISILMFLSILTSRYTEDDFLKSLPLKLMAGLSTLFISIIAMMIAFSTAFFIAYHHRLKWVPALASGFAFVPVTLYVLLKYRLLFDVFYSTYQSTFLFLPSKPMLCQKTQICTE